VKTPSFTTIETERLILRRFRASDLASFMTYRNDPEIARYQSWESITRRDGIKFISEQSRHRPGIPGKWFQFAAEIKQGGTLAGDCALLVLKSPRGEPPGAGRIGEIGYTFARAYQCRGLATEAARGVVDYGFDSLGLNRIVATTDCRNSRSVALMERLPMRREGHFIQNAWFKGEWCDEFQYAVLRDEWTRMRATR
jgi:RimJ/RimL family protein N-acetyltransferase